MSAAVAGCGGGGGGGTPPASALFVVNARTAAVDGFASLAPPAGSTTSGHDLATLASVDGPVAYDAVHDLLYVATTPPETFTDNSAQIRVFAHASTLAAGATPARSISLENSRGVQGMAADGASDTLWVFRRDFVFTPVDDAIIRRVGSASTATTSLDFVMTLGHWAEFATYDPSRDIVYIADGAGGGVGLMVNASTATPGFIGLVLLPAAPSSLSVDSANDRLYVSAGGSIYMFEHASQLTPRSPVPAPTIVGTATDRFWFSGATIR